MINFVLFRSKDFYMTELNNSILILLLHREAFKNYMLGFVTSLHIWFLKLCLPELCSVKVDASLRLISCFFLQMFWNISALAFSLVSCIAQTFIIVLLDAWMYNSRAARQQGHIQKQNESKAWLKSFVTARGNNRKMSRETDDESALNLCEA